MATYRIDHNSEAGYGLVLYIDANNRREAREKLRKFRDYSEPVIAYLGENRDIELRFYIYGQDLAEQELEYEDEPLSLDDQIEDVLGRHVAPVSQGLLSDLVTFVEGYAEDLADDVCYELRRAQKAPT